MAVHNRFPEGFYLSINRSSTHTGCGYLILSFRIELYRNKDADTPLCRGGILGGSHVRDSRLIAEPPLTGPQERRH